MDTYLPHVSDSSFMLTLQSFKSQIVYLLLYDRFDGTCIIDLTEGDNSSDNHGFTMFWVWSITSPKVTLSGLVEGQIIWLSETSKNQTADLVSIQILVILKILFPDTLSLF